MTQWLNHATLAPWHLRRSYRDEASDEAVARVSGLLDAARRDGRADLGGPLAHHGLTVTIDRNALIATIDAPAGPHVPGLPWRGLTMPLVTLAVPRHAKMGPKLWTMIARRAGYETPPDRPPWPWCAVWLHPTLAAYPDATDWLGDLERLIAWAWIESE